ncbi:hypothetical protein EDF56_103466 [Novosphingobium sp. PhB165]|uniref:hypothetical protein n=1 Tax=Novosphingobium sp. PhB165 TaxID=2485105 RepID=UPI001053B6E5|nr:hypothetical protein [Novosphingobium sp. PhB165]TCM19822.1 hypothetical protein EDF56_103466 [Novosphingobium sp. PhB165]
MHNPTADWMKLAQESYWLWADSMMVIGMRTSDMMTGQGSSHENMRMVTEKVEANAELAAKLFWGGPIAPEKAARKAVRHYRKRVRANRKRLSKG